VKSSWRFFIARPDEPSDEPDDTDVIADRRESFRLTDASVSGMVQRVFGAIRQASDFEVLETVVNNEPLLLKNRMAPHVYPPLEMNISIAEVEDMQRQGFIDNEGRLVPTINGDSMSTLEKLLYAIVWKNGDLGKERHIVNGVFSTASIDPLSRLGASVVFSAFGRHLADRKNPIIDQHVLRAFNLYRACVGGNNHELGRIRRKTILKADDWPAVEDYIEWLSSDELQPGLKSRSGYRFHVDRVLFALGRALKLR